MAGKKSNGTKRQSPSRERLLALALVRVVECVLAVKDMVFDAPIPEYDKVRTDIDVSIAEAQKCLADHGYSELRSIASRVAEIETELTSAIADKNGAKIALLGAALDRAKAGKPPLTVTEKKPKTTTPERKVRVFKAVKAILDAFDSEVLADTQGRVVASVKADETGKLCMVEFGGSGEWVTVAPKDLKPIKDASAKGDGTPAVEGQVSGDPSGE